MLAQVTGYQGRLVFDASKPDGAPRKLLDVSLLRKLGWQANFGLEAGLSDTFAWFQAAALAAGRDANALRY
jgi:GDP-L-fucose synthase